ncbi:hypothetical protein EDC04DRAFT_2691270 [Pisolithus marmoratus]|nr:hypothetical protein EDC04DRAFT_2691270 [Pisolithus marmoratus]
MRQVDEEPTQSPPVPPDPPMEVDRDDPKPPSPHAPPEPDLEAVSAPTSATLPVPDVKAPVPMILEDSVFYKAPIPVLPPSEVLTEEEREMSVEQWIRREISLSYDKLMADGQKQILLFKEKATEIRRRIDEL